MGFLHKIKLAFQRMFTRNNIEFVSEQKAFGNEAENDFSCQITKLLPDCVIKNNVIISSSDGVCEIDNLIQYKNKLFVVEIKNWKGDIQQNGSEFIAKKRDKYTNEIHVKTLKSPFAQIKRQIHLLKNLTDSNPWINPIVYFNGANRVTADRNVEWFTDIDSVVNYIKNSGNESSSKEMTKCISRCREADFVYSTSMFGERSCHCLIEDLSIVNICDGAEAKCVYRIDVSHHFACDKVLIYMQNGQTIPKTVENGTLDVTDTKGNHIKYNLCKIDSIVLGKR